MTPREIAGRVWWVRRDEKRERQALLALQFAAARGKPEAVKREFESLGKDG